MFKSKIIYLLIVSSFIMISLQVLTWLNGNQKLDAQVQFILSTEQVVKKMNLVALLSEKARIRTRLMSELIATEDIFDKDDIALEISQEGADFIATREKLLALSLSQEELVLLDEQRQLTPIVVISLREAVEFAMSDNPELQEKAKDLHYNFVLPGQGIIVDMFLDLLQIYEDEIKVQTKDAVYAYSENLKFRYYVLFIFLSVALFVIIYVSRKIYIIEKTLFIEKKRTHITLMSIGDAVVTTDSKGIILDCNKVAENIIRKSAKDLIGKAFSSIIHLSNSKGETEKVFISHSLQENKQVATGNFQLNCCDEKIYIEILFSPILEGRHKAGCVITFRDISEKRELEKKLNHQARFDALTGLFNRYSFEQKCKAILQKQDKRSTHSLCILDLDHFKNINDSCGHESGDLVLKQLANIMKATLREQDFLSRIGGDEFTIILDNCDEYDAQKIMQKIIDDISNYSFTYKKVIYKLGCSIGVTQLTVDDCSCSDIFKRADRSCYQAKDTGRNKVVLFSHLD